MRVYYYLNVLLNSLCLYAAMCIGFFICRHKKTLPTLSLRVLVLSAAHAIVAAKFLVHLQTFLKIPSKSEGYFAKGLNRSTWRKTELLHVATMFDFDAYCSISSELGMFDNRPVYPLIGRRFGKSLLQVRPNLLHQRRHSAFAFALLGGLGALQRPVICHVVGIPFGKFLFAKKPVLREAATGVVSFALR